MKSLTYNEFIALAKEHYSCGGFTFVECWDEYQFDEWVRLFGEITQQEALEMFALEVRNALLWAKNY